MELLKVYHTYCY